MSVDISHDIEQRKFLLETKNKLIMFAFVVVFSSLGVFISDKIPTKNSVIKCILYIIPFFVLVPISSRIVYYREWGAYLSAKIFVFSERDSSDGTEHIRYPYICFCKITYKNKFFQSVENFLQKIVDIMVNFEIFSLNLCCVIIFFVNLYDSYSSLGLLASLICSLIPIVSTVYIFLICKAVYKYDDIYNYHVKQWEEYKSKIL